MQKLWPYQLSLQLFRSVYRHVKSAVARRILGVPRVEGENLGEIARSTILKNTRRNCLRAGKGHFRYMWVADLGKSFCGLLKVLDKAYLRKILQRVIDASLRKKKVPTCFSRWFSFDLPWARADGLPWLAYAVEKYVSHFGDSEFLKENKAKLENIFSIYLDKHYDFETHLIKTSVFGDWADSVLRASSTYNNICLLAAFHSAKKLGLEIKNDAEELEKSLIAKRWNGKYFREFEASQDCLSADANIFVLYFKLFPDWLRKEILLSIEESVLVKPFPIRCNDGKSTAYKAPFTYLTSRYHELVWTHLGLVYLNGLKRNNFAYDFYLKEIEEILWAHKNFIELFDLNRKPYSSPFHVAEHSLTMAAGQYLELTD